MFRSLKVRVRNDRGLSLIEVIVAVTIMSVMCLAIYTTFVQGLKLWKRATSVEPEIDAEIIFEKITHDLRNAAGGHVVFKGDDKSMSFFSVDENNRLFYDPEGSVQAPPSYTTYLFDDAEKHLVRKREALASFLWRPGSSETEEPFGRNILGQIEYYHLDEERKVFQWKNFWNKDCLPEAVRVSLKYDDDSKMNRFVRVITIPSGGVCNVPAG